MKFNNKNIEYIRYTNKPLLKSNVYTIIWCLVCLAIYIFGLAGNFSFLTLIFAVTFSIVVNGLIIGNIYSICIIIFVLIFSFTDILSSLRYDYIKEYLHSTPILTIVFSLIANYVVYNNQKYKYKKDNYKKELEQKIKEGNNHLAAISFNFMDTLYKAYTTKNPKEKAHAEHVALLSKSIAQKLNDNDNFASLCYKAGLMHDIGKIKFNDDFFNKTEYTEQEYQLYKTHVLFGSELFTNIKQDEIALAIKHHHEKFNGTGYPDGLKGNEIPLIAQIVGLADEIDSLNQKYDKDQIITILKSKADIEYSKQLIDIIPLL